MVIYTKANGSVVLWKNPRTEEWTPVTDFGTVEAASRAIQFYSSKDYNGWETAKLSKSHLKPERDWN